MFYNNVIGIYTPGEVTKNKYGGLLASTPVFIKDIQGDVQPYSRELLKKEYGYDIEVSKRVFTDVDSAITEGVIFRIDGIDYEVRKLVPWDDYYEVMIYGI